MPVQDICAPGAHQAAAKGHDHVGAVTGPVLVTRFESIGNNGPATPFDAATAAGRDPAVPNPTGAVMPALAVFLGAEWTEIDTNPLRLVLSGCQGHDRSESVPQI